jgi:hypothetical protein
LWQNFLIGAFGPPCTVSIDFADAETRKQVSASSCIVCLLLIIIIILCSLQTAAMLEDADLISMPHDSSNLELWKKKQKHD